VLLYFILFLHYFFLQGRKVKKEKETSFQKANPLFKSSIGFTHDGKTSDKFLTEYPGFWKFER